MILIGPTGVGKTELVRSLSALLDLPYTIQDATSFTSAGYIGRDVDEILKDLYNAAGKNIEKAQKGIVFLDEFDKLRKSSTRTGQKDVGGESVQQALLKIIEGGEFDVKKDKMGASTFKFDTSNVLFILGGGIGCFMLGSKYCEVCISRGLEKIYSNYPDVEKAMFESLKDYSLKNNMNL